MTLVVRRARRVVAVALLLVAGACGVPTDPAPRPIPADRVPFDLLDRQLTPPAPAPGATP